MDYSLFLRAAHGLLKISGATEDSSPANHFDRRALTAFARFLSAHFLAGDFRWEANGLMLRLPPVTSRFLTGMASAFMPAISRNCSHILLRWDGTVVADCGKTDWKNLSALKTAAPGNPRELESVVAEVVRQAWREFCDGNLPAAERTLGNSPESDVFVVPPARARSMRWWRIFLGASMVMMLLGMTAQLFLPTHPSQESDHLKPVQLTEAQVRYALERKAGFTKFDQAFKYGDNLLPFNNLLLPPTNLMSAETLDKLRALILINFKNAPTNPSGRLHLLFDSPPMARNALINGWFTMENFGLSDETIRHAITNAPKWQRQFWFSLQTLPVVDATVDQNGVLHKKPANYTILDVANFALTIQCLEKLDCLAAVDGMTTIDTLLRHQILTDQIPPGRRPLPNPKIYHGLFLTYGYDPIQETHDALVILQAFGALDRIDREACVQGILRFYQGKGLFGWDKSGDQLVIRGDARDTLCAYESLRMLGALDRVKDLNQWQFHPQFASTQSADTTPAPASWDEIEAWICQQRLDKALQEHNENPQAPFRSLLQP
jgi:hypothetical protein